MKNAEELRDELSLVFERLKQGELKAYEAAEFANLGGKMIASAKAQVEYYKARDEAPSIPWLEQDQEQE